MVVGLVFYYCYYHTTHLSNLNHQSLLLNLLGKLFNNHHSERQPQRQQCDTQQPLHHIQLLQSLPPAILAMTLESFKIKNTVTSLPDLPDCTKMLCNNIQLTSLSNLPDYTHLFFNQLKSSPNLPNCIWLECNIDNQRQNINE